MGGADSYHEQKEAEKWWKNLTKQEQQEQIKIAAAKEKERQATKEKERQAAKEKERQAATAEKNIVRDTFKPIIIITRKDDKIYQCPQCKMKTGNAAPKNPSNTYLFSHNWNCINKCKIPVE